MTNDENRDAAQEAPGGAPVPSQAPSMTPVVPPPRRMSGWVIVLITAGAAVTVGLLLYFLVVVPTIREAWDAAHRATCMHHLWQVGGGLNFYAMENDGDFPRLVNASGQEVPGYDPETGKATWKQRLPSAPLPGGVLVNRHGRVAVVHENGSVSCFQ